MVTEEALVELVDACCSEDDGEDDGEGLDGIVWVDGPFGVIGGVCHLEQFDEKSNVKTMRE